MTEFAKENGGYKYLLTLIYVFSKYGWIILLKNKTGKAVASALKIFLTIASHDTCGLTRERSFIIKM